MQARDGEQLSHLRRSAHPLGGAVAEIGLDHARVGRDRVRRAHRDDAALGEHEHLLGEAHHRLHHMLDHHDGDAARADRLDHRHHVAHFGRVQAGQHLVEQQQLRLDRERTCELEPLAARDGEIGRETAEHGAQADLVRDLLGGRQRIGAARVMQIRADRDVLGDRQARQMAA